MEPNTSDMKDVVPKIFLLMILGECKEINQINGPFIRVT